MSGHRPPEGTHVTYAEDPVFPGDFFADLRRDDDGRVIETGSGTTREAARAHLLERYCRRQGEAAAVPAGAGDDASGNGPCIMTGCGHGEDAHTKGVREAGNGVRLVGCRECDCSRYLAAAPDDASDPHAARASQRLGGDR